MHTMKANFTDVSGGAIVGRLYTVYTRAFQLVSDLYTVPGDLFSGRPGRPAVSTITN